MIHPLTAGELTRVFRGSTDAALYQKLLARQLEEQRNRRDRRDEITNDEAELLDLTLVVISAVEAQALRIELDLYDTATVEALQRNEIHLSEVQERLDKIFAKSYTLPDGRKAWKTIDGTEVYDENGEKLDLDVIDPDAIADEYPCWETVKPMLDERDFLLRQRSEVLEYQSKLDNTRDRLDSGDMTREEFEKLRQELKDEMPDAVRAHVPGREAKAGQAKEAAAPDMGEELDISESMTVSPARATRMTPAFNG